MPKLDVAGGGWFVSCLPPIGFSSSRASHCTGCGGRNFWPQVTGIVSTRRRPRAKYGRSSSHDSNVAMDYWHVDGGV